MKEKRTPYTIFIDRQLRKEFPTLPRREYPAFFGRDRGTPYRTNSRVGERIHEIGHYDRD